MTDSPKRASTSSRMNPIWLNASTLMNMSWWFCIADLFHATIPRSKLIYNIYKHGICAFMLQFQLIHWCSSRIWTKSWNIQTLKLNLQKDKVNRKLNHSASSPRPSWNLTSSLEPCDIYVSRGQHVAHSKPPKRSRIGYEWFRIPLLRVCPKSQIKRNSLKWKAIVLKTEAKLP